MHFCLQALELEELVVLLDSTYINLITIQLLLYSHHFLPQSTSNMEVAIRYHIDKYQCLSCKFHDYYNREEYIELTQK
jgi:hypothetical protein